MLPNNKISLPANPQLLLLLVDGHVLPEVRLMPEGGLAQITVKQHGLWWFWLPYGFGGVLVVCLLVYLQIPAGRECFRALIAPIWSLARVRADVLLEDVGCDKRLLTEAARVFPLIVVTSHVSP